MFVSNGRRRSKAKSSFNNGVFRKVTVARAENWCCWKRICTVRLGATCGISKPAGDSGEDRSSDVRPEARKQLRVSGNQ